MNLKCKHCDLLNEFSRVSYSQTYRWKCTCGKDFCRNVCTLLSHYRKCPYIKNKKTFDDSGNLVLEQTNNNKNEIFNIGTKKRKLTDSILSYCMPILPENERILCDKILTLWITTNDGIAFRSIEDPLFQYFCKLLRPDYIPPSRKRISELLIYRQRAEIQQEVEKVYL
jgi:hypothetical protein